jgi:hypothetical protein
VKKELSHKLRVHFKDLESVVNMEFQVKVAEYATEVINPGLSPGGPSRLSKLTLNDGIRG